MLKLKNIWGLGIGDWGLGIGDWGLGPIPNPQSPMKHQLKNDIIYSLIKTLKYLILLNLLFKKLFFNMLRINTN